MKYEIWEFTEREKPFELIRDGLQPETVAVGRTQDELVELIFKGNV